MEAFLKNIADVRYSSVVPMYNSANKKFEIRNSGFRSSKSRNSFPFLKTFRRLRFFLLGTDIFLVNLSTHTILFITYIFAVSNLRSRTYWFITSERIWLKCNHNSSVYHFSFQRTTVYTMIKHNIFNNTWIPLSLHCGQLSWFGRYQT